MCRTGISRFGIKNWIFLLVCLQLFTFSQGVSEESGDWGVRWSVEPSDTVGAEGERIMLPCSAVSRHALRLAWRHDVTANPTRDHTLTAHDKYRKQLANGTLVIERMSSAVAGNYQCVATVDGIGTIVSRTATVFLTEVPEIIPVTRSVLGSAGGVALLPCGIRVGLRVAPRVVSAPLADRRVYAGRVQPGPPTLKLNVTWLKNGVPVRLDPARVSVTPSGALEIDPLRHHDAANYACRVAIHNYPHKYKTGDEIELRVSTEPANVESPPRFIATPQSLTVLEGTSVTFDCAATGNPRPAVTWLNNGAGIDLSDLDSRLWAAGSGSLRLQGARPLDAGVYTCRAHSALDSADAGAALAVHSPPRVTVTSQAVAARERGDVTLRCTVRGRPTPHTVWLKDGDLLSANNPDMFVVEGTSLRIQGVLRVDAGMFQCLARSVAGCATAAVRLYVQTPDDGINATLPLPSPLPAPPLDLPTNLTHDIFHTLLSNTDHHIDSPDDPGEVGTPGDFLGETSSAYTSSPQYNELNYDYHNVDNDYDYDDYFHAAQGLDLEALSKGNSSIPPPRGLRAVIVKHRFVTLSWEAPDPGDDVTGYAVVYRVEGSERSRVSRGAASRHEMNVAGLTPNTTYQFAVLAYTAGGVSPTTQSITVRTSVEEVSHGPPRDVRVSPAGAHALRVEWSAPAPSQGPTNRTASNPDKYTLCYTEVESGREQFQLVEVDPTQTSYSHTLAGLRPATLYSVSVSGGGGGGAGGAGTARTDAAPPAAPPANITAQPAGATSITVRWEAPPLRSHGAPLTGYKLRYRALAAPPGAPPGAPPPPGAPRRKPQSLTTPANARRADLTGLDTATTYQIRVAAMNGVGVGPFSEWVTSVTHARDRDETSVPPLPPPLTTRTGRDWISVSWSEGGGSAGGGAGGGGGGGGGGGAGVVVRGFLLGWGLGVPDETSRTLPHHQNHYVIRNLQANSEYVISLRASNQRGLGPAVYSSVRTRTAPALDTDDPDLDLDPELDPELDPDLDDEGEQDEEDSPLIPPVGVKAIMLSGSTAVVYWTDPTLPKGQSVSDGRRYVVRWSAAGGGEGKGEGKGGAGEGRVRYFNASDLNCMIDDLKPYTVYEFSVKLIKGGRSSAWSMLVSNTSLEAPPGGAPRDLRAAPAEPAARAADLSWERPARPNGLITGYVIMYAVSRAASGSAPASVEWTAVAAAGDRGRARVDRLRPRTTYLFKVQARNGKGLGPFCQPVTYTTAMESGSGGGLASATSAWLWASAGGACAVLALAAALALSLCCRRHNAPTPTSTYQKASASAAIKPPDLWIHHDQMELKHMDKGIHASASKISAGSVEGSSALVSSSLGGRGAAEYESARHPPPHIDSYHYHPTYVECGRSSLASDDTAVARQSPPVAPHPNHCRCDIDYTPYKSMTGMVGGGGGGTLGGGGGMGGGGMGGGGLGGGGGCSNTCERRQHRLHDHHTHASTPLLGVGSPQSSLASLHPPPPPCGSGTCPLGAGCGSGPLPPGPAGPGPGGPGQLVGPGGDVYACAARERGHYVAYEPLGHYTHRDSLSSDAGGSLHRRTGGTAGGTGGGTGGTLGGNTGTLPPNLHSFTLGDNTSEHSTPSLPHSRAQRDTSPYKKSASCSPGHIPNRLQLGSAVPAGAHELEPLTPSRSTERLHREMQNLEGLMRDLSDITTAHHFHC